MSMDEIIRISKNADNALPATYIELKNEKAEAYFNNRNEMNHLITMCDEYGFTGRMTHDIIDIFIDKGFKYAEDYIKTSAVGDIRLMLTRCGSSSHMGNMYDVVVGSGEHTCYKIYRFFEEKNPEAAEKTSNMPRCPYYTSKSHINLGESSLSVVLEMDKNELEALHSACKVISTYSQSIELKDILAKSGNNNRADEINKLSKSIKSKDSREKTKKRKEDNLRSCKNETNQKGYVETPIGYVFMYFPFGLHLVTYEAYYYKGINMTDSKQKDNLYTLKRGYIPKNLKKYSIAQKILNRLEEIDKQVAVKAKLLTN